MSTGLWCVFFPGCSFLVFRKRAADKKSADNSAQVSIIAASEHGAVPIKAIVEAIGRNRALVVLPSFLSANRLSLRQRSDMALDLPSQIFANETTLYVLPTVAHLKQVTGADSRPSTPFCSGCATHVVSGRDLTDPWRMQNNAARPPHAG